MKLVSTNKIVLNYLLHTLILHFALLARQRILQLRIIPAVHNFLAYLAEPRFSGHHKEWRIEKRMVLTQIIFALISAHLGLLSFGLQQFDVQVMGSSS